MVAFAEKRRGGPLRWFQWVCAQRRYEVRADGSWCWPLVFHSTSRQQGKSVDLAEDAAWYCAQCTAAELVLHSAHRVKTSLDVQAELWPWAEGQGLTVHRLLGDSRIVWPSGAVWATVATESAYGRRPKRLLSDESWAVAGVKFWNSLYPALGDFWNPQALFFSTANLEEQGLVSDLRKDPSVCRMEWGALEGEDQGDEGVWRASSAFWGPGRLSLMRTASTRPGFAEQWLNVWPGGDGAWRWLPGWATDAARGAVPWPAADVGVAGVESRWHPSQVGDAPARWAVAVAWVESGRVLARVERVDTLGQVVALVGDRRVHAHSSVVDQLAAVGRGWRCEAVNSTGQRSSAEVLAQLVRARGLTVDGVADETWAGVRVFPSDGGEVVDGRRSTVDVAGVKALGYAVAAASKAAHSGPVLVA